MSRQFDAVAQLRVRAATVAGWGSTWAVAYDEQPFTPPASRQWIEEEIGGGPGIPRAITPPNLITYEYSGTYTLTLVTPVTAGARVTLDMADALQSALLAFPPMMLTGGSIPLIIDDVEIGAHVPSEADGRRALLVRYRFYANATPGAVAVTPDQLILTVGLTQQLSAQAYDSDGNPVTPATFAWASSDPTIATVDVATGLVTAIANGTCVVTATRNGLVGQCAVSVASLFFGP